MQARVRFLGYLALAGLLSTLTIAESASGQATEAASNDPAPTTGQPVPPPRLSAGASQTLAASVAVRAMAIPTPPAGTFGINSSGSAGGGRFIESDNNTEAWVASDGIGITAYGSSRGGYFGHSDRGEYAALASGGFGIQASGTNAAGEFDELDGSGYALVAITDRGIDASGSYAGGVFWNTDISSSAQLGLSGRGIEASGTEMGGYFFDDNGTGYAEVGFSDYGIRGYGNFVGGYFEDRDQGGWARVGYTDRGIEGYGTGMGGYFSDSDSSGYAYVGYGDTGIEAKGTDIGGHFADSNGSGNAFIGMGGTGIEATGNNQGGYFTDADSSGYAYVGYGDKGIEARGNHMGGHFHDRDSSGYAYLGIGDRGIEAHGDDMGGYFCNLVYSGYAEVGYADYGIRSWGNDAGGSFHDLDHGVSVLVGTSTYKVVGAGAVSFVQNHPSDPDSVIVYASPEGDEVATYTRGTARLVDGEVVVPLGETFAWVTNPDLGLTAYLTPVGSWCDLYVAAKGTDTLVVRSRDGADCTFDYIVYGLRIGFEEVTIVQEKTQEAYIPSMRTHRERAAERPEYARSTALARFTAERRSLGIEQSLDLSRAHALKAAIHEFDPKVDRIAPPSRDPRGRIDIATATVAAPPATASAPSATDPAATAPPLGSGIVVPQLAPESRDLVARSFSSPREQLATRVAVRGAVEPGDVLVVDREQPDLLARGAAEADPTVVGIVVAEPAVALGARPDGETNTTSVAVSGIVRCKVDASYGAVQPGDLLVTSPTPGHAMRIDAPLPGTVVGKALEPLASGQDLLRVLVMLR